MQDLGRMSRETLFDTWLPVRLNDGSAPQINGIFVLYQHEGLRYYFGPFLDEQRAEDAEKELTELRTQLVDIDPKFRTSRISTVITGQQGAPQSTSLESSPALPAPEDGAPSSAEEPDKDTPSSPAEISGTSESPTTPSSQERPASPQGPSSTSPESDGTETTSGSKETSTSEPSESASSTPAPPPPTPLPTPPPTPTSTPVPTPTSTPDAGSSVPAEPTETPMTSGADEDPEDPEEVEELSSKSRTAFYAGALLISALMTGLYFLLTRSESRH